MRLGATQIDSTEAEAVADVLSRQILYRYHGSTVSTFERRFARWLGGEPPMWALAVNSGSSALQLAFAALDLEPGFEVLLPTLGFVSAATAIASVGGVPRFVPVDMSLGIHLEAGVAAVTSRTSAILAVHMYGAPCDLRTVGSVARGFGGAVVEDVAQACGGTFEGTRLGRHGTAAVFSFQHFKLLTTGEGGLLATADPLLHARAVCSHDAAAIWTAPELVSPVSSVRLPPLNLRMSEMEGALGLVQLDRCDASIAHLRRAHALLRGHLEQVGGVALRPPADAGGDIGSNLVFYVDSGEQVAWVTRALRAEGVNAAPLLGLPGTNRHWAGDWVPVLERCGIPSPDRAALESDRALLSNAVILPLDLRYTQRDIEETLVALEKVLPA